MSALRRSFCSAVVCSAALKLYKGCSGGVFDYAALAAIIVAIFGTRAGSWMQQRAYAERSNFAQGANRVLYASRNGSDACPRANRDVEEPPRRQIGVARRPYADPPLRSGAKLDGLAKWL